MSRKCDCSCNNTSVIVPVTGFGLGLDLSAIGGSGGGDCCPDYSLEEQWTGRLWIDGKKIYQKTVDCGMLPNTTTKNVPHGIEDLDYVIAIQGTAEDYDNMIPIPHVNPNYGANVHIAANKSTKSLVFLTWKDMTGYSKSTITLFYTRAGN